MGRCAAPCSGCFLFPSRGEIIRRLAGGWERHERPHWLRPSDKELIAVGCGRFLSLLSVSLSGPLETPGRGRYTVLSVQAVVVLRVPCSVPGGWCSLYGAMLLVITDNHLEDGAEYDARRDTLRTAAAYSLQ